MALCCGGVPQPLLSGGVPQSDEVIERVWPWDLLPGGVAKWMPLTSAFSALGLIMQVPIESAQRIIEYNHRFGWWQLGGTGAPPGSGVVLDSAAARLALPSLKAGYHPVMVLCGQENSFGPQALNTFWSFGELQYLVPFCTNANCNGNVQWTYRITAIEDSLPICIGSWYQFAIPCTHANPFVYDPPLVAAKEQYYGKTAMVLPPKRVSVVASAPGVFRSQQLIKLEAAAEVPEQTFASMQRSVDYNFLAVLEQPWFSDPTLSKWGAYNFDLDRASFRVLRPEDVVVTGMPTEVLPEMRDSAHGLDILYAMVALVPFAETIPLGRKQLSLLDAVRARKANPSADVSDLLPAQATCCGVGCACGPNVLTKCCCCCC